MTTGTERQGGEFILALDFPDAKKCAEIWDTAVKRHGNENRGIDNVIPARASHEFTPAEFQERYRLAASSATPNRRKGLRSRLIHRQSLAGA